MIKNAKAIWLDSECDNQYMEARRSFTLESIKKATLQICADAEYAVFINDIFVGTGQYKTFPGKKIYDEYDVSDLLKKGENTITITAYHQGKDTSTYVYDTANLCFALSCGDDVILSDEDTQVRLHPYYESGEIEMVSPQLGYTYHYDATLTETPWQKATVIDSFAPALLKRPVKKLVHKDVVCGKIMSQGVLMRTATDATPAELMQSDFMSYRDKQDIFSGTKVKKQDGGVYLLIDLGKKYAGLFTMTLNAAKGTVIDIGFGEHLEDLRVRTSIEGRSFACRYVANGADSFTGYFRRLGCRYLQIHITNMTDDVDISSIGIIPTDYPIARQADFRCDDYFFNKLYDVSLHTMRLCMHEHHEDCPWREQALYAYDAYVQMMCGYYAFGEYEFARASLELLADSQRADGLFEITAPGRVDITIPSFSLAWIISLEKYVLYSGDTEFGEKMRPVAEKILSSFALKDNLVYNQTGDGYWFFYEWVEGLDDIQGLNVLDGTERKNADEMVIDAACNFYYIQAADAYKKLCSYIGTSPLSIDVDSLRKASHAAFYDESLGLYKTRPQGGYHELTQALAFAAGVTESDDILDKLISRDSHLLKTTLSSSIFKYEALLSKGEKYIDAVTDEIADIWGGMLFSGSDTLWEVAEGIDFDTSGSLCHAWSAVPIYLLYRYYIGYAPTKPGFGEFTISPVKTNRIHQIDTVLFTPTSQKAVKVSDGKIIK